MQILLISRMIRKIVWTSIGCLLINISEIYAKELTVGLGGLYYTVIIQGV
jgi:hypothetical protein